MIKIIIPEIPPSNNKYIGRGSKNYQAFEYQKKKKQWQRLIKFYSQYLEKPLDKAKVTITYYFPDQRKRDPDNYSGKFILDGLVKAGVIVDDSFKHIELEIRGRTDKNNPRTEITVKGEC